MQNKKNMMIVFLCVMQVYVQASEPKKIPKSQIFFNLDEQDENFFERQPTSVFFEDEGGDSDRENEKTDDVVFADPEFFLEEPEYPRANPSFIQPVQPFQVRKISLTDDQIPPVVQNLQNQLLLKFTGVMSPDEVIKLMHNNGYSSYDENTQQKIAQQISYNLQHLTVLADAMYEFLQQSPRFSFRPTDDAAAKERYLKNYLWSQNGKKNISDALKEKLLQRFLYKKLNKNEFLKFVNDIYSIIMQDSDIQLSHDLNTSKKIIEKYVLNSNNDKILTLREKLPIIVDSAYQDFSDIIDNVARRIVLPVNRQAENLSHELQQKIFERQLAQVQEEKDRLEEAMQQRKFSQKVNKNY